MQCAEQQNDKYNALNNVLCFPLYFRANMDVGRGFCNITNSKSLQIVFFKECPYILDL